MKPFPMDHKVQRPKHYVPSYETNIRETFDKERRRLEMESIFLDMKVAPMQSPRWMIDVENTTSK